MSIASTPRRASVVAFAAAAALSLPATASASPIQDPQTVQPTAEQVSALTSGDGAGLAIPLGGGALALVVAGGGYLALRGSRLRHLPRVHVKA
jgi:hypothetical protein